MLFSFGVWRHAPRKIFTIKYFAIESGGTFYKMHIVTLISHDYVIVPTTLNIKQVKFREGCALPAPPYSYCNHAYVRMIIGIKCPLDYLQV